MFVEDVPKPTGEVSGVCWSLLCAMAVALVTSAKHLSGKNDEKDRVIQALHAARLADRDKFEASTRTLLEALQKKNGGNQP